MKLIDKDALVAGIERIEYETNYEPFTDEVFGKRKVCKDIKDFLNTLEVKDPYEQTIQYPSIKDGIKAHAEIYSFNIESLLFNQLTKEQQALWRKEIEQACISGGEVGVELARDTRYKENAEVKEVDLEKELDSMITPELKFHKALPSLFDVAKHFFELGLNASNTLTWEDVSAIRQIIAEYRREENHELNNEDFCKEVLKRFKVQKGEQYAMYI